MDLQQVKDILLMSLASIMCGYTGLQLRELTKSVQELNLKIAVLLGQVENHEHRLNRIEGER